jgi:formate dehydrogenase major subunit
MTSTGGPKTAGNPGNVRLRIDGVIADVPAGGSLLEALLELGFDVPHLCYDPRLAPAGACRLCNVEIVGRPGHVAACTQEPTEGLVVRTRTAELEAGRKTTLELLASRYPAEDAGGSDPLHRYFARYGVMPQGTHRFPVDETHPYIRVDMSRCIDCFRCVRICRDVEGQDVWSVQERSQALRVVPDGPSLRDSSCVSCGACVDTCPSGALEDRSVVSLGEPAAWTRSTCPYCGTGCETNVGTRDGRIVDIRPVLNSKVSKGHLCVKGRYAFAFEHSEDRLTHPMIRRGAGWERVSWPEAVRFVADSFQRIVAAHGKDSVGVLGSARATNEDNYVAQKFARVVLGTNNVDCCARVCHAPTAFALSHVLGAGASTNSFDDVELAAGFLVCGANPLENHPIVGARIRQAVRRGARLVVIDPRRTELAELAHVHLRVKPGKNVPLLHAMAFVVLEEGLFDADFVRTRVAGVDRFRALVQSYSPERVAAECGVDAAGIRAAARLYATSRPAMEFHGLGVTEHTQGVDGVRCLANLALLTGNFGKRGSGMNPLRGQNNVQGSAHMGCEPSHLTGYATLDKRADFERVWVTALPAEPGRNLMQMVEGAHRGTLRGLWAIGYDVLLTNPEAAFVEEALSRLDLLVVQDLFLNETARRFAHVVLPAASSFEKDGTFMNSERRVQRVRRAVDPPGEARADYRIVCDVAAAMGRAESFSFDTAEDVWNEVRKVWPAGAGISYRRIEHDGLQWPCPREDHPGTEVLHVDRFSIGPRAEMSLVDFMPSPEERERDDYPFVLLTGRTRYQFNAGTMTMRTPNVDLRPGDVLDISPSDAERLGLSTGDLVTVRSRYGAARLPVAITDRMRPGELFATFTTANVFINRVTSPYRDGFTDTPEYKMTAVRLER